MSDRSVQKVVILGGGTAGWMTAAALGRILGQVTQIELVESDAISTVGVGESTIPQIKRMNRLLDIDEATFLRRTKSTVKLGIEFNDWGAIGDRYLHALGKIGIDHDAVPFIQYYLRHRKTHPDASYWDYCFHEHASLAKRFKPVEKIEGTPLVGLSYAYHFDAGLYAMLLREIAEKDGVKRTEGRVTSVQQHAETGNIKSLTLESGQIIEGDLFIDCSGFRSLLLGQTLNEPWEDWSDWLIMDSAVTVGSERLPDMPPFTRASAQKAGWQWRIPLQHRTGNGHVYSSAHLSDDEATAILLDNLETTPIGNPRTIKFKTGRYRNPFAKNVVAIGLASGFVEPLEATSIHMIQSDVSRLIDLFPSGGISGAERDEYNAQNRIETEHVRDFIILHYKLTTRDDTPFWQQMRDMPIPDTLQHKMDVFEANGRVFGTHHEMFRENGWPQVALGQGLIPRAHDPKADRLSDAQLTSMMTNISGLFERLVPQLPPHKDFIATYMDAPAVAAE